MITAVSMIERMIMSELGKLFASWPVSRVLYGLHPKVQTWRPFLWDEHCCPPQATNPDGEPETALQGFPRHHPYSVLLQAGFAVPLPLPVARWSLTPPFHPCPSIRLAADRRAVCSLWHFPWGCPRRTLSGAMFPWSPDFPHMRRFRHCMRGRPASWQTLNSRAAA